MSKAPYKLPTVFVGCPYGGKFKVSALKNTLDRIPFRFYYADTTIRTRHLLALLSEHIKAADFCVFDISTWNPNVSLEIGLAQGLGKPYYILLNQKLSSGVPADIQGIQRIEYLNYNDLDSPQGLWSLFVKYLVKDKTHPKNIWKALEGTKSREKKFYLAMRCLAHLREHKRLTFADLSTLSRGTYLHKDEQQSVTQTLARLGLITNPRTARGASLKRKLFADPRL